jgi:phosphatidylethanolamine/phosphatidyl-N-methylethanolamine N-methyltransferase
MYNASGNLRTGGRVDLKQLDRVYSIYSGVYDRVFGRIFQESRDAAIRGLEVRSGERILEVGVGTGLCLPLYPKNCSVVGIDLSAAMLEKAALRLREHRLSHVKLIRMDAGRMHFRDDAFDTVIAAYVVTAVPDYRMLMREIIRVCRPVGRIVLLNHFTNGNKFISVLERAISPLCEHIGFRTDLSVDRVLDGTPLVVSRHENVRPFGMWHLVECRNHKNGASADH